MCGIAGIFGGGDLQTARAMIDALVHRGPDDGHVIAGAFNLMGENRLFGRYWGALEEHPFLHFNVCFYHSIDECILRGIEVFEGGAGGEHKVVRGFEPAETYSAHLFLEPRVDAALRRHLVGETAELRMGLERWRAGAPILKRED